MKALKLETFLLSDTDWEKNQYKVLGGIKEYKDEFKNKKVYPALSELIELSNVLEELIQQRKSISNSLPKQIKEFDLKNKKLLFETIDKFTPDVEFLFELIEWALPMIKETIEEGIVLYEYVEKNLKINHVGILPLYKSEGYFIVPDNHESTLQVHRFECSLFSSGKEPYRALKTKLIEAIEQVLINTPEIIKLNLIDKYKDLPNPATYICETELDFPFSATLFPVAKRKLISSVAA